MSERMPGLLQWGSHGVDDDGSSVPACAATISEIRGFCWYLGLRAAFKLREVTLMRMIPFCVLVLVVFPAIPQDQNSLPRDIHPVTLSRLPPVTPAELD